MDNQAMQFGGNMTLASAALAIGTSKGAVNFGAFACTVDGIVKSKGAGTSVAYSSGMPNVAPGYERIFVWATDGTNVVTVAGPAVLSAKLATGEVALPFPPAPKGYAPFGATRVKNAGTSDFVTGTTLHDAANITTTYYNLCMVPSEPLRS